MSILTKLLRDSYDLQESKGEETAYWHLQNLREAIKNEQIKGETLPIDSVRLSLFNEVYDKFVECENDDEFTQYLNENTNEA
jgi:hypothetical protein